MTIRKQIVRWAMSGPPHFDGPDAHTCWSQAWGHSGVQCSLDEFRDVLKGRGVMCTQVRNMPPLFRIWIPGSSAGNSYGETVQKIVEGMR